MIYTFYSYKGGAGRSMALANVGALLAKSGKTVLIVDCDLEAPGIERFFYSIQSNLGKLRESKSGMLDLFLSVADDDRMHWRECLIEARPFKSGPPISIITAGKNTPRYVEHLQSLDWNDLFEHRSLGEYLETLRTEWRKSFDFVLIDSRTGITDIGGICTILLPDVLVTLFTTNDQSVIGVADVVRRAKMARERLPVDRTRLVTLPVLGREERSEYERTEEWKKRIAADLGELYWDWLPGGTNPSEVLRRLYIPYVPFWSFGERLPVQEKESELGDPGSIGSAYSRIADLLLGDLNWEKLDMESKEQAEQRRRLREQELEAAKVRMRNQRRIEMQRQLVRIVLFAFPVLISLAAILVSIRTTGSDSRTAVGFAGGLFGGVYGVWTQKKRKKPRDVREQIVALLQPMLIGAMSGSATLGLIDAHLSLVQQLFIGFLAGAVVRNLVEDSFLSSKRSKQLK
jgi:cellulose biosynthesis protein BcsQ